MRGTCGEPRLLGSMLYGVVNTDCSMHERVYTHTHREKENFKEEKKFLKNECKIT